MKDKIIEKWNALSKYEKFAFGYFPAAFLAVGIPLTGLFCLARF